jgi:hypothetical protein
MALGRKTGGRVKGTPNKGTVAVAERLEAIGCDPIEGMARIAMDINTPLDVRAKLYSELAQYIAPKRKAIEHSGESTGVGPMLGVLAIPMKGSVLEAVTEQP